MITIDVIMIDVIMIDARHLTCMIVWVNMYEADGFWIMMVKRNDGSRDSRTENVNW